MPHADEGLLHAYLDGELSALEVAKVESHLGECAACRARLDEERALVQRASQLLDLAAPPHVHTPPLKALGVRRPLGGVPLPLAWAATVVLALGLGWYVGGARAGADASPEATTVLAFENRAAETQPALRQARPPAEPTTPEPSSVADRDAPASPTRAPVPDSVAAPGRRQDVAAAAERAEQPRAEEPRVDVAPVPFQAAPVAVDIAAVREAESAWTPISVDSARNVLGADPVALPDLPIYQVQRRTSGVRQVLIEQQLPSGVLVGFTQTPATEVRAAYFADSIAAVEMARARRLAENAPAAAAPQPSRAQPVLLARYVGSLRIEISGPVSADSLNRLLDRARPIP